MNILKYILFISVLIIAIFQCKFLKSSKREAGCLVGNRYKVIAPLLLYGVCPDGYPERRVDYYVIYRYPGFSGKYIVDNRVIGLGSVLVVKEVRMTNYINGKYTAYVELIGGSFSAEGTRIHLSSSFFSRSPAGILVLDEAFFRKL